MAPLPGMASAAVLGHCARVRPKTCSRWPGKQTQITRSIQSLGWPGKPNYALYIIMSESPVIKEVESNFDSAN